MAEHHHHHHHHHHHGAATYGRAFIIGITLNLAFVILEFTYGTLANSLALIADAGHNLGDVLGLLLAWGASVLSRLPASQRHTYGLRRSSILAALANAVVLLVTIGGIGWEAIERFSNPGEVAGATVIWVALAGIVINAVTAWLFFSGRNEDLNIRGAFLHLAADAAVSGGVVLAGAAILVTGWLWLDPVVSLIIAGVILIGTWNLLRAAVNLALDAVPEEVDIAAVQSYLTRLPGVVDVHDLHIWAMSTTETALTAHLVVADTGAGDMLLSRAGVELHDRFGIEHATLQLETNGVAHDCRQVSCCPVAELK